MIYKHVNDNIFSTICRVNIHLITRRKKITLYLHRRDFTLIRCSAAVSLPFLHDHHHRCAARLTCPWLCLTALCAASYIESSFGTWGCNRDKCSQCSRKCCLGRLLNKNLTHSLCTTSLLLRCIMYTANWKQGCLSDATFEVWKSVWLHYF